MSALTIGVILLGVLFLVLGGGLWISFALLSIGILGMFLNGNDWGIVAASSSWSALSVWSLTALPMFMWMGEILFRTRLSQNLFDGLSIWLNRVPGKMLHINVLSCGIFAAISGSSAATVATIGNITLPQLNRLGYGKEISIGSLGGAGTLGLLIPPSIVLIVYGVAADVSIARLFIAGVFPGILIICLFIIFILMYGWIKPNTIPKGVEVNNQLPFLEKIKASFKLLSIMLLIIFVLGSIYFGICTPNEAAAIGVVGSLILGYLDGSLTVKNLREGILGALTTSSMLLFIIACANVLSIAMAYIGIPRELAGLVTSMNVSNGVLLIFLAVAFIVLGCFLDGISIILLTTSVILPVIQQAGIDLIWFGIFLVLIVEMAQITPPVGFNLFVLQSLTGENILKISKYCFPFFLVIMVAVYIIWLFPEIVTFLPQYMTTR